MLNLVGGAGIESDDESRRVPEIGSEVAGPSTSVRAAGSVAGSRQDQVQASAEAGQRKRGRSPADKEHKRLKRWVVGILEGFTGLNHYLSF